MSMTHESDNELVKKLQAGAQWAEIGGVYSHYKNQFSRYVVDKLVIVEADDSVGVTYYPQLTPGIMFFRPLDDWLGEVEVDGVQVPRFTRVEQS